MDKLCQSCGMPLKKDEEKGTNADGTLNEEYCIYCFEKGKFTQDFTMEEMVEHNLKFVKEFNESAGTNFNEAEAREQMLKFFPSLKRWNNN